MPAPELLLALLRARGPSGREDEAARVWREAAAGFAEVSTDSLGSSFARVGSGSGPLLAIVGHVDEIGLAVTHVDDAGFVFFRRIGGWSGEVLVGQRVEILTRGGVVPAVAAPKEREPPADRRAAAERERAAPLWIAAGDVRRRRHVHDHRSGGPKPVQRGPRAAVVARLLAHSGHGGNFRGLRRLRDAPRDLERDVRADTVVERARDEPAAREL